MVASDEDALICDFAETYHILDYKALPLKLRATLASGLRDSSRSKLILHGREYAFMDEVRQKKDPNKPDKMFGLGFDDTERIVQTRGYAVKRDMSQHLLKNRLEEIRNSFT